MCFGAQININLEQLSKQYNAKLSNKFQTTHFKKDVSGFLKTDQIPAVICHHGELRIEPFYWSLVPKWADEFPIPWSTYNARMNRGVKKIFELPTYKDAFSKNKFCLIPLSKATEACYWGSTKGKIINFGKKDSEYFFVLGLYESWISKNNQIKNTLTLLTDNPYQYLFEHGHDRSLIIPNKDQMIEFISNKKRSISESYNEIKKIRVDQTWCYEILKDISQTSIKKNTPTTDKINAIKKTVWCSSID